MIAETFRWWLVLEGIGLLALPIPLLLFRRLPGRGYAFAKPLGLLLGGYLFWMALSLPLLPNRPGSIVWVFLLLAAIDVYLLRRRWQEMRVALTERLGLVVAVEVVFTAALFTAAHLRSYVPEIGGTEKPMEIAFLNAAARSRYYPPDDPWFAGAGVSYYYFGYVIQAMVAKLAAVKTSVAFNLGLASTVALALTAAYGLGYELARLVRAVSFRAGLAVGVGALGLVGGLGHLEGVVEFGIANGVVGEDTVRRLDINDLEQAKESGACLLPSPICVTYPSETSSVWWWWRATRISPEGNPITEFPFFSFLLGDLHPHVLAIPYVLLVAGLGLALWRSEALSLASWRKQPFVLLLAAVLLGGLGFLNAWDLPTFAFVIALFVLALNLTGGRGLRAALADAAGFLLPLVGLAVLLYLPFYLGFSSQASGVAAVRDGATRPLHSALFWAPLLVVSLPLPFVLLVRDAVARAPGRVLKAAALPALLLLLWAALVIVNHGGGALGDALADRGWSWLTALFFAAALVICLLALWRAVEAPSAEDGAALLPVLAATGTALLLILRSELFYLRDVFNSRLHTLFKLYYQAWLLLGVSGAFAAYWLVTRWRPRPGSLGDYASLSWTTVALLCLGGALLYPLGATLSRTECLTRSGPTLDGLAYALRASPEDYAAATWLRDRAVAGERLVEGVGAQYSAAARVAAWTGISGVLGWAGHGGRGGRAGAAIGERGRDVDRAYTTGSLAEAETILRKYGVTYVFVGGFEREKYPAAGLAKFEAFPAVFPHGQTVIYRLPVAAPAPAGAAR